MRYNETTEDVVITGTTYYRTNKVTFHIPEGLEVLAECNEVRVNKVGDNPKTEEFTRSLSRTMTPDVAELEFQMYDRQGNPVAMVTYKQMFWAVESFYRHLAELEDNPVVPEA